MVRRMSVPVSVSVSVWAVAGVLAVAGAEAARNRAEVRPEEPESRLDQTLLSGLRLRGIGPALMSGRISDIAIHPRDQSTWYVAVGSGGVWKTENAGTTWTPVFDGEGSYSIGCVTVDPRHPEVVWVGTGENVSGRHVGYGDGLYKSIDGGKSWENVGLATSEHIGKVLVDPRDSRVILVAAEGPLWAAGGDRGVYRSADGGATWDAVLSVDENTGATDLEYDPGNPDIVYAATYERRRHIWSLLAGGPGSGIWKSEDAGLTWRELTSGLPSGDMGKIGLAVSPLDPATVYATIEAVEEERGFYRSTNGGETWEKRSSYVSGGTGPHYYQEIYASPHRRDRIYQMDVWIHVSNDGGKSFAELGERNKHSDNHALAFDPHDPEYLLAGSDGGLYETFDHGESWKYVANLPVTQFYKICVDNETPVYNVIGGTQDNGTQLGPSRTLSVHGIRNRDWVVPLGADGYACAVDPENSDIVYAEWQRGSLVRWDKTSGEAVFIQPQPGLGEEPERWNWDAPIILSPHSSSRLYFGSQRLWRSDDRGDSWRPVSGDLTRGRNRYEMDIGGRVRGLSELYDNTAMSWYSTLTAVAESPLVEGLLYVGSDDGLIQISEDGGGSWRRVERPAGVPELAFVQEITASVNEPDTVYAVFGNHKLGDFNPYLVKSSDRGRTWRSVAGDLPDRHIVWSMVEDHEDPDLLFVGTEFGIFVTLDGGTKWTKLDGGVPTIAFRDLEIQRRESDLVGGTFGRGFYILDDYSPLRTMNQESLEKEAVLFPVRDGSWYLPANTMATRGRAYQGSGYYLAENPPYGVVFTYYLREEPKSAAERRGDEEKKSREQARDVPFPGWEALRDEALEHDPAIVLTVRNASGDIVRRLTGSAESGLQRISWDLHYPPVDPVDISPPPEPAPWASPPAGPLALPGSYSVELALIGGASGASGTSGARLRSLAEPQSFELVALDNRSLPGQPAAANLEYARRAAELNRRVDGAAVELESGENKLEYLEKAFLETPGADLIILEQIRDLERGLAEVRVRLLGDPVRSRYREPSVPSIRQRARLAASGIADSRYGPTGTQRESLDVGAGEFAEVGARLKRLLEEDLPAVEAALEEAGAPWTPGRRLPG